MTPDPPHDDSPDPLPTPDPHDELHEADCQPIIYSGEGDDPLDFHDP